MAASQCSATMNFICCALTYMIFSLENYLVFLSFEIQRSCWFVLGMSCPQSTLFQSHCAANFSVPYHFSFLILMGCSIKFNFLFSHWNQWGRGWWQILVGERKRSVPEKNAGWGAQNWPWTLGAKGFQPSVEFHRIRSTGSSGK